MTNKDLTSQGDFAQSAEQERLRPMKLREMSDDFSVGEKSGAFYYKGERLCTAKELAELTEKLDKVFLGTAISFGKKLAL